MNYMTYNASSHIYSELYDETKPNATQTRICTHLEDRNDIGCQSVFQQFHKRLVNGSAPPAPAAALLNFVALAAIDEFVNGKVGRATANVDNHIFAT